MVNSVIVDRLNRLRKLMAERKISYYLIPTADFHGSEYISDYFKTREYFGGFTGSAGNLLVWKDGAALWTDGRYFIQAAEELEGTGIELMKMGEEGVPTLLEFLSERAKPFLSLGFDGRVVPACEVADWKKKTGPYLEIHASEDLADLVWEDRPSLPAGKVMVLPEHVAGESTQDRIARVRNEVGKKADALFLTKLDDIMWLLNIRGCDVECNPVALSYLLLTMEGAMLFIQEKALDEEAKAYLEKQGILILPYETAEEVLGKMSGLEIIMDSRYCSYSMVQSAEQNCKVIRGKNPTELMKAVKSPAELGCMRDIYLKDSLAVTKFIFWLKEKGKNNSISELSEITAADELERLRREIPEFLDLSFPTIAGYGPNAAMMHYEATADNYAVLKQEGFLLVDSGGQYLGGTTDVTRTISLGGLTEEQKRYYTLVAAGMIQMTFAKFLYGCTGRNLDILARQPIWDAGLDYKCGTGHGVGYILNVHEGPHALRWKYNPKVQEAVFEEGMVVTNEPGIYVEGSHGIRIENVMVAKKGEKNEYGQFMEFETLTFVPLDREAIDTRYLTDRQVALINVYQRMVYDRISPFLTKEEQKWLMEETAPLKVYS